jgi:hypothetical protein
MNKTQRKNKAKDKQVAAIDEVKSWIPNKYHLMASVFILSAAYFYFFGAHIFFYQENLLLFIFTSGFLKQFAVKPGGLLEYSGYFINQFYFSNLYGAIILASVFSAIAYVFSKINEKLTASGTISMLFAAIVSCLLILTQTNINYFIHNNLGLILTGLYFLLSLHSDNKYLRVLVIVLFPLFYYVTGAFAWIFLGMYLTYNLLNKKIIYPLILVATAGISLLFFKTVLFLQPLNTLLYYPFPVNQFFTNPLTVWSVFLFFALYPGILKLADSVKADGKYSRIMSVYSMPVVLLLTVILLTKFYKKELSDLFNIEKKFFAGDWEGVIGQQEKERAGNLTAQYYYITALSESGKLENRLFFAPHDFKAGSICIPWNSQVPISQLFRGVYFYYSIGLVNEAHRWAFESLVIQGYRPENIKLLIKTELINGHYKIAAKYIYVLKRTLHYRKLAEKYEKMLNNPELIKSDPDLGEKIRLMPESNFIVRIRDPFLNISSLSEANPTNKKAFEYELAWQMLNKDLEGVARILTRLPSMNYEVVPRHIEEAIIFIRLNMGLLHPELDTLKVSQDTETRYANYITYLSSLERNKARGIQGMPVEMRNTFWYYLNFK